MAEDVAYHLALNRCDGGSNVTGRIYHVDQTKKDKPVILQVKLEQPIAMDDTTETNMHRNFMQWDTHLMKLFNVIHIMMTMIIYIFLTKVSMYLHIDI